ncbi:MAG: glutamate formimidoyltransferase [Candidatus Margulisbacteria bacterium]|nr:glutamate formimidoyltransferase [Candidatus Margulisiibacteriota bacterium]MBU1617785.1 glutamate formimidoyltransferase [Candidatus Margulisiibacteriota bacterium]
MTKLIECVPNFSEGVDSGIIEEIVSAIRSAKVRDLHSDPDHNRSVVTMWGEPQVIKQAAFELTEKAIQLLDIREHAGVHPYIGAVDVIPFIPLKDCSMAETVALARELGKELWEKLKLPVFFYGEAARVKERRDLPMVRKGGYRALKQEINTPRRCPDVGTGLHASAGAVAVGAREFLIAFNVNLKGRELDLAQSIAKNIREKNGGLPGVRALGLELPSRGLTQVSVNIVDHQKTSLKKLFDEINKWAKEYEVEIEGSELVGMIPASACFEGMKEYLHLPCLKEEMIIDRCL